MMMETGYVRSTPTRPRVCGRQFAIFYARFVGLTGSFPLAVLRSANLASTSSISHASLSYNGSLASFLNVSQQNHLGEDKYVNYPTNQS